MNALGRGLASLIPQRKPKSAEGMLEQIDSMEEVLSEEPENVRALRQARDGAQTETVKPVAPEPKARRLAVEAVDDEEEAVAEPVEAEPTEAEEPTEPAMEAEPAPPAGGASADKPEPEAEPATEPAAESEEDSLLAVEAEAEEAPAAATEPIQHSLGKRVERIPVGDIELNPLQPRQNFDADEMTDLVNSLHQHGMIQPLVVTKNPTGAGYQLVAGERRLRAARELKWDTVPCVVRGDVATERKRLELALVENIHRQNLDPIEEAMGYQRLSEEYGMTHEEIGERVGRSRVGITNIMRVLQLPAEVQRGLSESKISIGHARAILMIPDAEKQVRFYNHLLDEGITVRKAENRARRIQQLMNVKDPMRDKTRRRPALALKYEGKLLDRYGYNVRVKFNSIKNRFDIIFNAHSEAEAEEVIGRLLGTHELPKNVDADILED
jgi:ParB family chromosome partitioning protein